jgi:hypothetical protein
MKTVYFDETGNTGAALLDVEQPIFVLASVALKNDDAYQLLSGMQTTQASEIKFVSLRKTDKGQKALAAMIQSVVNGPAVARTIVVHKQYLALSKFVDLIVEPIAHGKGINIYKQGYNIALSNLLFASCPMICGELLFNDFLGSFVAMVRYGGRDRCTKFFECYIQMGNAANQEMLKDCFSEFEILQHFTEPRPLDLDPAILSIFFLITYWSDIYTEGFNIFHDDSKPVYAVRSTLQSFFAPNSASSNIGFDSRKFQFPLKAQSLEFVNSRSNPSIQLADLIAGATSYWAQRVANGESDEFSELLQDAGVKSLVGKVIWPTDDVTPEALGTVGFDGIDPIAFMTNYLQKRN